MGDDSFEGQEYFIVSGSSQQDVIFTGNVTVVLDDNDGMELLKYTILLIIFTEVNLVDYNNYIVNNSLRMSFI